MTLSVLEVETGQRVLTISMLQAGTMKAETHGERLVRAINNMTLLAAIPTLISSPSEAPLPPHSDAGYSPIPWALNQKGRDTVIQDCRGMKVATLSVPNKCSETGQPARIEVIQKGLLIINRILVSPS
jgi:hypothetical protein